MAVEDLLAALRARNLGMACKALDTGVDPNAMVAASAPAVSGSGDSLMWPMVTAALVTGNPDIAGELISRGADIDARDSRGQTPLMWLCMAPCTTEDLASIRTTLALGADVNALDRQRKGALDMAAANAHALAKRGPGAGPGFRGDVPLAVIDLLQAAGARANRAVTEERIRILRKEANRQKGTGHDF